MSFWGVKLEPGKPYTHCYNNTLGRLRITQVRVLKHHEATFGDFDASSGYVSVQCKVGNKSPISLCSMHTDTNYGSCVLDIEFEEKEHDVVFEVVGSRSVHLTGYYLGHDGQSGKVATGKVGSYSSHFVSQMADELIALEMGGDCEYKDRVVNGHHVRTMVSGLVIEELKRSKNREIAYHGCRVNIRYCAQIMKTGYVFESNYTSTFGKSFILGTGAVIKGLDEGINGMHVGDKRRLIVPPSMGYCGSEARSDVPADAWVIIEVDLEYIEN